MSITCPKCRSDYSETLKFCGNCGTKLDASVSGRPQSPEARASFTRTVETSTDELIRGTTFAGRYQIIEELGKGGMGRVYKAMDREINEAIALKVLSSEISVDKRMIERFRNELKLARKISHRNICRIGDSL
jgi:serine/threonine protein kinase